MRVQYTILPTFALLECLHNNNKKFMFFAVIQEWSHENLDMGDVSEKRKND